MIPSLGSDMPFCSQMCRATGVIVIDANYCKAPENPFLAALHDVEDVIRWVLSPSEKFDPSRVVQSGFSAGANLALVASSSLAFSQQEKSKGGNTFPTVIAIFRPLTCLFRPS